MKTFILLFCVLFSAAVQAVTLSADPFPNTAPQPASFNLTITPTAPAIACTRTTSGTNVLMNCNLDPLPAGVYTIVANAIYTAGCVNATNSATCTEGGTASSVPFNYSMTPKGVEPKLLKVTLP